MTGSDVLESRTTVLLRCEELKTQLEATKERLDQAAWQLEELTRVLLVQKPPSYEQKPSSYEEVARPWLDELLFNQLVGDVMDAERKLAKVRTIAAELGIPLPPQSH